MKDILFWLFVVLTVVFAFDAVNEKHTPVRSITAAIVFTVSAICAVVVSVVWIP